MNIIQTTKQRTTIPPLLLFSISLFLLCNGFMAAAVPYAIGDTGPGQGIVFFISADGEHGLEAAPSDQSTGIHGGMAVIQLLTQLETVLMPDSIIQSVLSLTRVREVMRLNSVQIIAGVDMATGICRQKGS